MCRIYCAAREELRYFGVPVSIGPPSESWWEEHGREYERWSHRSGVLEHEHAWIPIGCHMRGRTIACGVFPPYDGVVYELVPALRDEPLARELAVAFAVSGDDEERWELAQALRKSLPTDPDLLTDPSVLLTAARDVAGRDPWRTARRREP